MKVFKENKGFILFIAFWLSFVVAISVYASFLEDEGINKKAFVRCIKQMQITEKVNETIAEESAERIVDEENYCEFSHLSRLERYLNACEAFYILTKKERSYLSKRINEC